jgi:hypothetical protein
MRAADPGNRRLLPAFHSLPKRWLTGLRRFATYWRSDLEAAMGSSSDVGRGFAMSDDELLRTIGADLRSFYAEVIHQPLPAKIQAALARIDDETLPDISPSQPPSGWRKSPPAYLS